MIEKKIEERPWGRFEQFTENEPSTVKLIFVEPGEELSLQQHHERSEFWRVVSGNPTITIGKTVSEATVGDEFSITREIPHRIAATRDEVVILEISEGTFNEKDIVRVEDKYGRV